MQVWSLYQEDPPGQKNRQLTLAQPGKFYGQRSQEGCSALGHKETDVSQQLNNLLEHLKCPQSNLQSNTFSFYVFPRISSFPHRRLLFLILRKRSYSMCLEHHCLAFLSLKISFISQALAQILPPLGSLDWVSREVSEMLSSSYHGHCAQPSNILVGLSGGGWI